MINHSTSSDVGLCPLVVNARFRLQKLTGVQRYADEICSRLQNILEEIRPSGQSSTGARGHLWEQTTLPRVARGKVLWSPCNVGPILARRHVVTIHDMAVFDQPQEFSSAFHAWYRFLIPQLVRNASRILTVSEFSKSRIVDLTGIAADKVVVVHNGVDFSRFGDNRNVPTGPVHTDQPPFVLTVGAMSPRKNFQRLLKAWELAGQRGELRGVQLYVVGDTAAGVFSEVKTSSTIESVRLLGRVSDAKLQSLYRDALVCVNPSLYEGFGLPIVEAFAAGCPVICSNRTSYPEVGGAAADYFDPESLDSIASTLVEAVARYQNAERRHQQSLVVRQRAREFDWDQAAGRVFDLLREVSHET